MRKGLQAIAADPRVEEISDETGNGDRFNRQGDGYWVYLRPGWWDPSIECHFIHEWKVADVVEVFKGIERCECEQCQPIRVEVAELQAELDREIEDLRTGAAHNGARAQALHLKIYQVEHYGS